MNVTEQPARQICKYINPNNNPEYIKNKTYYHRIALYCIHIEMYNGSTSAPATPAHNSSSHEAHMTPKSTPGGMGRRGRSSWSTPTRRGKFSNISSEYNSPAKGNSRAHSPSPSRKDYEKRVINKNLCPPVCCKLYYTIHLLCFV